MIVDRTRSTGRGPWDETWFVEGTTAQGEGLWLRYTVCDRRGDAPSRAAVWAAWRPKHGPILTGYAEVPREEVSHAGDTLWSGPAGLLTPHRCEGKAGPLGWDLQLHGGGGWPVDLVPSTVARMGRTYRAALPDLTALGTLTIDGQARPLRLVGLVGHLYGARSRIHTWGWGHAGRFDDAPGSVLEVLVASLTLMGRPRRTVGSAVLRHRGRTWSYATLAHLLRSRVTWQEDGFELRARGRTSTLRTRWLLPDADRCVTARYDAPDGQVSWVRNAPGMHADVSVRRFGRVVLAAATERAVGETGGVGSLRTPPQLGRISPDP